jgi:acyl-CoA synthetase (AMP-forming)/AMP-acid ligase II
MNVYPREVEQCILELDGVEDVAVVGVDDERWGQAVAAAVVLTNSAQLTEDDVVAHCRTRLASFKKPNRVFFLAELPRTAGLKVARSRLRDQLEQTA